MDIATKIKSIKNFKIAYLFNKEKIKQFINYEKELAHNPHKLALSFALGIFVGLAVPMGLQTLLALPIALLLRCNIFVVYLASLITNPFTAIFIYALMFKIGELITSNQVPYELLEKFFNNFSFKQLTHIGSVALKNFLIGMIILTFISVPTSYYVVLLYAKKRRELKKSKSSN